MKEDDYVRIPLTDSAIKLSLSTATEYMITKVVNDQWLGLSGLGAIEGILYHKRFFERTGKVALCKWICLSVPHDQTWMRTGDIYEGSDVGDTVHIVTPTRSCYVLKGRLIKVRNWEEVKHAFSLIHQGYVENALKFTDWKTDVQNQSGSAAGSEATDLSPHGLDQG